MVLCQLQSTNFKIKENKFGLVAALSQTAEGMDFDLEDGSSKAAKSAVYCFDFFYPNQQGRLNIKANMGIMKSIYERTSGQSLLDASERVKPLMPSCPLVASSCCLPFSQAALPPLTPLTLFPQTELMLVPNLSNAEDYQEERCRACAWVFRRNAQGQGPEWESADCDQRGFQPTCLVSLQLCGPDYGKDELLCDFAPRHREDVAGAVACVVS